MLRRKAGSMKKSFTHFEANGGCRMVPVGAKLEQYRRALAEGKLVCRAATLRALRAKALPKGDLLTVAQVAGIQAAKRAAELIPLCHPLPLDNVAVRFHLGRNHIRVSCDVETHARTGAEMEALTGVAVAALTLYDMCKAVDKSMRIEAIHLVEKVKR
jgi:cyclic pyranopterin phosphate synthase